MSTGTYRYIKTQKHEFEDFWFIASVHSLLGKNTILVIYN